MSVIDWNHGRQSWSISCKPIVFLDLPETQNISSKNDFNISFFENLVKTNFLLDKNHIRRCIFCKQMEERIIGTSKSTRKRLEQYIRLITSPRLASHLLHGEHFLQGGKYCRKIMTCEILSVIIILTCTLLRSNPLISCSFNTSSTELSIRIGMRIAMDREVFIVSGKKGGLAKDCTFCPFESLNTFLYICLLACVMEDQMAAS